MMPNRSAAVSLASTHRPYSPRFGCHVDWSVRRMQPKRNPVSAHLHQHRPVHAQQSNRGATCRRQPNQDSPTVVPGKMVAPQLKARVIKLRHFSAEGVRRRLSGSLAPITGRTTQAEVVDCRLALNRLRHDVIDLKGHPQQRFCAQAVGAAPASVGQYLPAQRSRNALTHSTISPESAPRRKVYRARALSRPTWSTCANSSSRATSSSGVMVPERSFSNSA